MAESTFNASGVSPAATTGAPESASSRWSVKEAIQRAATQDGSTLLKLSHESAVMVVFLRHFGCVFCRETVADIAHRRRALEMKGIRVAFVHMADEDVAAPFFAQYGLDDVARISDPDKRMYRAFGLERGTMRQLFGLKTLARGFKAGIVDGHGIGKWVGDVFQMPGVFVIHEGDIVESYRHDRASDRPNYFGLAGCEDPKTD